jgi:hypothetical protein
MEGGIILTGDCFDTRNACLAMTINDATGNRKRETGNGKPEFQIPNPKF